MAVYISGPDFCFNILLFLLLDMCQNGEIPNCPETASEIAGLELFRVRFWKTFQHGSCSSRSELSDHIKCIKIGRRMKNLGPNY